MLRNIFTQGAIDARLIAFAGGGMGFEPVDQIGIEAQGQLLFDGAKKDSAPRATPSIS